ncbi:hypothetical protein G6F22_020326 [Rhizopus arrhizus]|nr:hypothetical protein G6F22_020326 [Rhizopus arrhizus]
MRRDADRAAAGGRKRLAVRRIQGMVAHGRPHHPHPRADAAAVMRGRRVQQAIGGVDAEAVHPHAHQHLPGVVQLDLVLHVVALALHLVARIAVDRHPSVVLLGQVGVVQVQRRHGLRPRTAGGGRIQGPPFPGYW